MAARNRSVGPRSVHSGHFRMVYGPDMGDGVVTFVEAR